VRRREALAGAGRGNGKPAQSGAGRGNDEPARWAKRRAGAAGDARPELDLWVTLAKGVRIR